jgi:hypothetical protein
MHRMKVPIHKAEFFLKICESQVYYVDANAVFFLFVPIKRTRPLAVNSERVDFLESPFRHQFFPVFLIYRLLPHGLILSRM